MEKIRFGIVGLGNQGSNYALGLFDKGNITNGVITALCDNNPANQSYLFWLKPAKEVIYKWML